MEIFIAIYDPTTGAKLIDETFTHQVETDETEEELHSKINMISASELISAFEHIAPDMGERLCDAVIMQPWKGSILSTAADKIIIPYGKSVGLKPGDVFYVYRNEETIQGFEGQKFFIPGPKTGEIKIVTVHPDRSEAIQLAGENILPGSTIIPKN